MKTPKKKVVKKKLKSHPASPLGASGRNLGVQSSQATPTETSPSLKEGELFRWQKEAAVTQDLVTEQYAAGKNDGILAGFLWTHAFWIIVLILAAVLCGH